MAGASGNVRAGRAFVEIMLDQNKLEEGLKTAKKKLNNFGSALTSIGKGMVGVSALAATPLAFAAKTFADFDDEMRMVKAVTNSTETEFKHLTETAEKLGRETSFTAKQVAEGMTAMGRMGFNSKEIDSSILAVLNLSRATGTELGNAAEIAAAKKQLQSAMDEVKSRAATKNGELKNIEKKVAKAQQGTQAARVQVESVAKKSIGAWSVQELSGMLNLGGSAQERTAKATELIAANTRESNKLIKNLNATSQTGTTYI